MVFIIHPVQLRHHFVNESIQLNRGSKIEIEDSILLLVWVFLSNSSLYTPSDLEKPDATCSGVGVGMVKGSPCLRHPETHLMPAWSLGEDREGDRAMVAESTPL